MSVESSTGTVGRDDDDGDEWVAEHCAWWVHTTGYVTKKSGSVHVPAAVANGGGNDPDDKPDAATLCYTDGRQETEWMVKSHAKLPPGFRDVCSKCKDDLKEEIVDE